jgi:hypothetical protein
VALTVFWHEWRWSEEHALSGIALQSATHCSLLWPNDEATKPDVQLPHVLGTSKQLSRCSLPHVGAELQSIGRVKMAKRRLDEQLREFHFPAVVELTQCACAMFSPPALAYHVAPTVQLFHHAESAEVRQTCPRKRFGTVFLPFLFMVCLSKVLSDFMASKLQPPEVKKSE